MSETAAEARSRRRAPGELTPRQREVLDLLAKRHTNGEIAEKLGISLSAAKWHVSEIMGELGVDTREEAAEWWRKQNGLPSRLWRGTGAGLATVRARPFAVGASAVALVAVVAIAAAMLWHQRDDETAPAAGDESPTASVTATVQPATPTASATPDPFVTFETYPAPARDEVLVYTVFLEEERTADRGWPVRAVVVQDLATGQIRGRWVYSGVEPGYPGTVALAGDFVITSTEERVTRYNLDGSGEFVLFEHDRQPENGITDVAVSPDGSLVAFSTQCFQCGVEDRSYFVRVSDGAIVSSVGTVELRDAGFFGYPWQLLYHPDGSGVFVAGGTGSERPGGRATIRPDGTFIIHNGAPEGYGTVSPDGGMVAEGYDRGGDCMHVAGARMRIFDHTDDRVIFDYHPEGRLIAPWEWSPDGSKLLVLTIPPHPPECTPPAPEQQQFLLLDIASFTFEPVASVRGLHEAWYGDTLLQQWCEDPSFTNPVANRWGDGGVVCAPPTLNPAPGDVFLGANRIASGIATTSPGFTGIEPVGFID